jgi:hypothetical protein
VFPVRSELKSYNRILWRIYPLLGKDLETDSETTPVAMQRVGRDVSGLTVTHATGETGCYPRGPHRGVMKKRIRATSSVNSWQVVLYWNFEGRA